MAKPDASGDGQQKAVKGASLGALDGVVTPGRGLPPVHLWHPPDCGEMDLRILRDGTWLHEGRPITRAPLVRLFSTILRRDGARYCLVTPVEKLWITVEDAPFIAVDLDVTGAGADQQVRLVTNMGDAVDLGPDHALRVDIAPDGTPAPYAMVRAGLEARIDRKTFYRLVDLGVVQGDWFGLWSGGVFFPLERAQAL